ncbi:MAG: hypothetical protein CM1200mP2_46320 [Planctomycetaceae bacterium]|nr:MAG: hypothetical protein CM1200mP2_46320 [Planctomycetaceae bacterium]
MIRGEPHRGLHLVAIAGGRRAPALAADYEVPAKPDVDALLARDDFERWCWPRRTRIVLN